MEDFATLDISSRSKKSAAEWAKEKLKAADLVAVGVNLVVGALLLGGLVGALFLPGSGAPDPDVNAAIGASHEDTNDNSTETSSGEESMAVSDVEDAEEEDKRQKGK